MAEYIERENAYTLAKKICDAVNSGTRTLFLGRDILDWIDEIPAADVRPVVLCKDCKWTKTDGSEDPAIYCKEWDRWEMPPDGFCWLGEKRDEN